MDGSFIVVPLKDRKKRGAKPVPQVLPSMQSEEVFMQSYMHSHENEASRSDTQTHHMLTHLREHHIYIH